MNNSEKKTELNQNLDFILNPNCSEVVWRLKGISQTHKGTNQESYSVFINQILRVFAALGWNEQQINKSGIYYIKGDGGPEILATSYFYALDLVNKIRDPREVDTEELEDRLMDHGYDHQVSKKWHPIFSSPPNPKDPLNKTEKILKRIWKNFNSTQTPLKKKSTSKKSSRKRENTNSIADSADSSLQWLVKLRTMVDTYFRVNYISERRSLTYASKLSIFREKIMEYSKTDPDTALLAFRYIIDEIPCIFEAVDDSYGSLADHLADILTDTLTLTITLSTAIRIEYVNLFFDLWINKDDYGYFMDIDKIFIKVLTCAEDVQILENIVEIYLNSPKIQSILQLDSSHPIKSETEYPLRQIHKLLFPLKVKMGKINEVITFAEKSISITQEYFLLVDLLIQNNQIKDALELARNNVSHAQGTYKMKLEEQIRIITNTNNGLAI